MNISKALLKYGYYNFRLEIIEYCSIEELLKREKHFIDLLGSEYNIVKDPTLPPMSGRTHSDKTKQILSDYKTGENHPNFGKTLSEETKQKISDALSGKNHPKGALRIFNKKEDPLNQ
jgi:group I intron endonuclease